MKKNIGKNVLVIFIICGILQFCNICFCANNTYVRSEIYKNITSYTCEAYFDNIRTENIENNIYDYYNNKRMSLRVIKKITSKAYIEEIRQYLRDEWTVPFYLNREYVVNNFDKLYRDLYIVQEVDFDFRKNHRTAFVTEESIWGADKDEGLLKIILNISIDEPLPRNQVVYGIDNSAEYGKIANDAIAFLESIKDIYFDEKVHEEYVKREEARQRLKKLDDYIRYYSGNLTNVYHMDAKDNYIDYYADVPSIHNVSKGIYEGWMVVEPKNSVKLDYIEGMVKKSMVYCRFYYDECVQYNLAEIAYDDKGKEIYRNVLEDPEKSTFSDSAWMNNMWREIYDKFKR